MAQCGEEQPFHADEQRFQRLEEEELEYINQAHFEHAVEISRQLMMAKQHRLIELNAQHQAEAAAREQARFAQNKESPSGKLQHRRWPCSTAKFAKQGCRGRYGCMWKQRGRTTTRQARRGPNRQ